MRFNSYQLLSTRDKILVQSFVAGAAVTVLLAVALSLLADRMAR